LTFPSGALSSTQSITVTSTTNTAQGVDNLSPVYEFGPTGLTFAVPVTVKFTFTAGIDPVIVWSSSDGTTFDTIATATSGSTATGQVTHFSEGFVASGNTLGSLGIYGGVDAGGGSSSGAGSSSGGSSGSSSGAGSNGSSSGTDSGVNDASGVTGI
jgi:hypothetical protein